MDSFFIAFYVAESSSLDFKHNECNFYNVMSQTSIIDLQKPTFYLCTE